MLSPGAICVGVFSSFSNGKGLNLLSCSGGPGFFLFPHPSDSFSFFFEFLFSLLIFFSLIFIKIFHFFLHYFVPGLSIKFILLLLFFFNLLHIVLILFLFLNIILPLLLSHNLPFLIFNSLQLLIKLLLLPFSISTRGSNYFPPLIKQLLHFTFETVILCLLLRL